jgi:hypothetical protein
MDCIHENIGLTHDGSRIIVCWDCEREFVRIARDESETLIVPISQENHVVIKQGSLSDDTVPAVGGQELVQDGKARLEFSSIQPCAVCGYNGSCDEDDGGCHS